MENLSTYALSVFMSFFAIMNPIANTPIFLGLVEGETDDNKKKIARKATIPRTTTI
jgi:multiple antibiotic resistance protein